MFGFQATKEPVVALVRLDPIVFACVLNLVVLVITCDHIVVFFWLPLLDGAEFISADDSAGVGAEHEIDVDAVGGGGPEDDAIAVLSTKLDVI